MPKRKPVMVLAAVGDGDALEAAPKRSMAGAGLCGLDAVQGDAGAGGVAVAAFAEGVLEDALDAWWRSGVVGVEGQVAVEWRKLRGRRSSKPRTWSAWPWV